MLRKSNNPTLQALFEADPQRSQKLRLTQGGWELDYAGIPVDQATLDGLNRLARQRGLAVEVQRLLSGEHVNTSEDQPALHMALRAAVANNSGAFRLSEAVVAGRRHFLEVASRLHSGQAGLSDLIHVGIGGSDLGPRLVADALEDDDSAVAVHWLSTLDRRRFKRLCRRLDPARTGLVIASKSFSTEETLVQARAVCDWLGDDWFRRCWAATASTERARAFGLPRQQVLSFPAWTGGRFSLWSSVGVSAAACIGRARFEQLLAGAARADQQFSSDPSANHLGVMLALLMHFLRRELNLNTLGFVSYEPRLALLADYLQQLIMESLGKSTGLDHASVDGPTAPLVFGGRGTDLQHSIFQALHQGSDTHPLVLIGTQSSGSDDELADWSHRQLAHLLAQARAFVHGRRDGRPFQQMPGNRPVATLLTGEITPERLGWLLATFEHAVYSLSVLWGINAFDQWGVEQGKRLAAHIYDQLRDG